MRTANTVSAQQELVSWVFFNKALRDHIQNGACRALYPQIVADIANSHLEHIGEALVTSLATLDRKEQ
jgi:hypothetical protein